MLRNKGRGGQGTLAARAVGPRQGGVQLRPRPLGDGQAKRADDAQEVGTPVLPRPQTGPKGAAPAAYVGRSGALSSTSRPRGTAPGTVMPTARVGPGPRPGDVEPTRTALVLLFAASLTGERRIFARVRRSGCCWGARGESGPGARTGGRGDAAEVDMPAGDQAHVCAEAAQRRIQRAHRESPPVRKGLIILGPFPSGIVKGRQAPERQNGLLVPSPVHRSWPGRMRLQLPEGRVWAVSATAGRRWAFAGCGRRVAGPRTGMRRPPSRGCERRGG
ncbi:hypothetical protein SAMN05444521_0035 [Streptomyces sp. 3214.6]|nr:hypothetical protein SAMN05444521_0035 [Streptomyces sp. 3214.6]